MADVLRQVRAIVRKTRRCFVCQHMKGDTVRLSAPHVSWRAATKTVCADCLAGQPWSLKATASADDPMLQWLNQHAPLFALLPAYVARCLLGHHKHPPRRGRSDYTCLKDWRITVQFEGSGHD